MPGRRPRTGTPPCGSLPPCQNAALPITQPVSQPSPPTVASAQAWRSGPWRIDAAARALYRDGIELPVPAKALACLLHLVANHHRAVGRDELIEAVWGHPHLSDGVLAQTVFQLRRLLGQAGPEGPIRSVRGFGYRWVAPVEPCAGAAASPPVPATADDSGTHEPAAVAAAPIAHGTASRLPALVHRRRAGAWLAAALALAAIAWIALRPWPSDPAPADRTLSGFASRPLLVLPVQAGDQPAQVWMRLGLMELIADRLRLAGLGTVPGETAIALRRAHPGPPDAALVRRLAAATGAGLLVSTQVRQAGSTWVVAVDLLPAGDARAGRVLAESDDPLAAARLAVDRAAVLLGRAPGPLPAGEAGEQALLLRVEAAMLGRDLELASQLISAAEGELRSHPALRLAEAAIAFHRLELPRARGLFEALIADLDPDRQRRLHARARTSLASVHALLGEPGRTRDLLETLVRDLEGTGDADLLGVVLMNLGLLAQEQGDLAVADRHLVRARHLLGGVGDLQRQSVLASNLGVQALRADRPLVALTELEGALAGFEALGDAAGQLHVLAALLEVHLVRLDLTAAARVAAQLDSQGPAVDRPLARAYADTARTMLLIDQGRLGEASRALAGLEAQLESGQPGLAAYRAVSALLRARLLAARTAPPVALAQQAGEAVSRLAGHANLASFRAEAWHLQVRALLAADDLAAAGRQVVALDRWAAERPGRSPKLHAHLALASLERARGDAAAAASALARAWVVLDDAATPAQWLAYADAALAGPAGSHADPDLLLHLAQRLGPATERHFGAAVAGARILRTLGPEAAAASAGHRLVALAGERTLPADLRDPRAGGGGP